MRSSLTKAGCLAPAIMLVFPLLVSAGQNDSVDKQLERLLADYRAYELPLPPADAKLVRYCPLGGTDHNLAFLTKPKEQDLAAEVICGLDWDLTETVEEVEPRATALKKVVPHREDLLTAIQCKARGWDELARALLTRYIKAEIKWRKKYAEDFDDKSVLKFSPESDLAAKAWGFWDGKINDPTADWKEIEMKLTLITKIDPTWLDEPYCEALLRSLRLSLKPSNAKPGSIESLIDGLVEVREAGPGTFSGRLIDLDRVAQPFQTFDPRYLKLALKGFDAVPALIRHLDDERLTKTQMTPFNNFSMYRLRVGYVVSDLLEDLGGDKFGRSWLRRRQADLITKAAAQAWWKEVQKVGEEAHLLRHVYPVKNTVIPNHQLILRIIAEKYPQHMVKFYRESLEEGSKLEPQLVADALAHSSLPRDKKRELFLVGAKSKNLAHRKTALRNLRELDPQEFHEILIQTLQSIPKTPTEIYSKCPEASFVALVTQSTDPRVWATLETVARRCDVGLRMEFLHQMECWPPRDERTKHQRLQFLAAFLDDSTLRDQSTNRQKFADYCAGYNFERLEVRNYAAIQIAAILKLDVDLNKVDWAELHQRVRAALKN